jgi:CRISPR-associated protein Cas5t
MEQIGLYVSVPIACFRVPRAREYFESFPCPPPATVYGMLLSIVGEVNRRVHEGAEIAIAMLSEPVYSTVLRTLWRVKDKGEGLGLGNNRRPDFQELLADVRLGVWVRRGTAEMNEVSLAQRLLVAINKPSSVTRFGGLSLGESTHMVDELSEFKAHSTHGRLLVGTAEGDLSLPIWVDHVGSKTRWQQYKLIRADLTTDLPENAWTTIMRPEY